MNQLFRRFFLAVSLLGLFTCAEAQTTPKALPNWSPEPALVGKLGPKVTLEGCAFRPPVGFRSMNKNTPASGRTVWTFATKDHFSGVATDLYVVTVVSQGHPTGWTRETALSGAIRSLEHDLTNYKVTPPEQGHIGNLPAARCYVKGDLKLNSRQRAMAGRPVLNKHLFVYVVGDGNLGITMIAEDIAPYNGETLPLLETSVLTMRPISSP